MKEKLQGILQSAKEQLAAAADARALDDARVKFLGKKGELTAVLKQMGKLSAEERPAMGQLANEVRSALESAIETAGKKLEAAALEANPKAGLLAVHDAARPLVDPAEFDEIIRLACRTNAAAPAVPVTDTIKAADPTDGRVLSTPDRSTLFAVQTPQVMEASLLKAALQSAIDAGAEITDDCSAVERLGKEVYLATGSRENIKITTPLDLLIAEAILRGRDR